MITNFLIPGLCNLFGDMTIEHIIISAGTGPFTHYDCADDINTDNVVRYLVSFYYSTASLAI